MEPFRTSNRFSTATVFGIIAYEMLKFFEEVLFQINKQTTDGVLVVLVKRAGVVFLLGYNASLLIIC